MDFLTPEIVTALVQVVATALLGGVAALLPRVFDYLKIKRNSELAKALEPALLAAIRYGFGKIPNVSIKEALTKQEAQAAITQHAKAYVETAMPNALKKLGVDGDQLTNLIFSRLLPGLTEVAATVSKANEVMALSDRTIHGLDGTVKIDDPPEPIPTEAAALAEAKSPSVTPPKPATPRKPAAKPAATRKPATKR